MDQPKQPWHLVPGNVRLLVGGLVALTLVNLWTVWTVGKLWTRVQLLPTHFSSSPATHVDLSPLTTGVRQTYSQIMSTDVGETVTVAIDIKMAERVPGYELFVRYREREQGVSHEWVVVEPELVDGLDYRAELELDPATDYEYQVMQTLEGEIVRLTSTHFIRLKEEIGSPDVTVYIVIDPRVGKTRFSFSQHRHFQLDSWQVERVALKLDNVAIPFVAAWLDLYHSDIEVDTRLWEAAKKIEVTVYYQDGVIRSLTFSREGFRPDPLIVRRD